MNSYKLAQLRLIAFRCGLAISGTKPILYSRILHELACTTSDQSEPKRILSIDMGIRNMAYCTLDLDPKRPTPLIHAWKNLTVSMAPVIPPSNMVNDLPHSEIRVVDQPTCEQLQTAKVNEVFDPITMSQTAYTLLRNSLLVNQPTHIIIERQRFRTQGGKHVFEWTLRVNMLEAILNAILFTFQAEGIWKGSVTSVSPLRVGPFWLLYQSPDYALSLDSKSKVKQRKIDLVRKWLKNGTPILDLGNDDVRNTAKKYLDNSPRRSHKSLKKEFDIEEETSPKKFKLDDLSDCLLQGLAWIHWERNKRVALRNGLDALLSP